MRLFCDATGFRPWVITLGVGLAIAAVLWLYTVWIDVEARHWRNFVAMRNCQPVAHRKSAVPTLPDRVAWRCDDGKLYVR